MKIEISHGRVIDPKHGIDRVASVYIAGGKVVAMGAAPSGWIAEHEIDARGLIVCPGLIDLSARLREKRIAVCVGSGGVGKTTLAAAIALGRALEGGKVLVCTIPNSLLKGATNLRLLQNKEDFFW